MRKFLTAENYCEMASVKKLKLTQIRSKIGSTDKQKRTLQALGLRKIRYSVEVVANPQIVGMISKVKHLITVEEVK
ncbi:MAG: 50S ribosomal protein L30 [Bacteroidota bacterium]